MTLLVLSRGIAPEPFADCLRRLAPERAVRVWPDIGEAGEVRYALAWKPPTGALAKLPNLAAIFSIGAGVDHLFDDPGLPPVPIVRFVDPNLTLRMREYVVLHVLLHQRRMPEYGELQRRAAWQALAQPAADEVRVGVMGLGVLGADAACALAGLGFKVAGWSRTAKALPGVACYAGAEGLEAFLGRSDILVCLLPLTAHTQGLLDRDLFAKLARDGALPGPVLINAGRGGLHVESDIIAALADGTLWACSLDVFEEEPLPASSPLWRHPRVVVTPHTASVSDPRAVCRYVLAQIARLERGEALDNIVDPSRGY